MSFQDISLFLAIIALILLIASELLTSYYGKNILINQKKLRNVAIIVSFFFLITVAEKIYEIIIST